MILCGKRGGQPRKALVGIPTFEGGEDGEEAGGLQRGGGEDTGGGGDGGADADAGRAQDAEVRGVQEGAEAERHQAGHAEGDDARLLVRDLAGEVRRVREGGGVRARGGGEGGVVRQCGWVWR